MNPTIKSIISAAIGFSSFYFLRSLTDLHLGALVSVIIPFAGAIIAIYLGMQGRKGNSIAKILGLIGIVLGIIGIFIFGADILALVVSGHFV